MGKILLCISPGEATVALGSIGKLREVECFEASERGLHALRTWLAPHRGRVARITVDTADEEYRLENIPHVPARQRQEILERKLSQLYRGSRLRAGRAVRGVHGTRREDQCLIAAYADERIVVPWLDALQDAGLLVAGIYPVPLLLVDMLRRTRTAIDPVLLVMRWSGGIRQTVLSGDIPIMTRVTSIGDEAHLVSRALEEVRGTRDYLGAIGRIPGEATLPVLVLDPTICLVDDAAQSQVRLAPLPPALMRYMQSAPSDVPPGIRLQLHLLTRNRSSIDLAPPVLREPLRRRNIARLVTAGSLCVGMCCAATAAVQAIDATRAARQRMALGASLPGAISAVSGSKQSPPTVTPEIERALQRLETEAGAAQAARRVYLAISRALDAFPRFTLESLRWEHRASGPDAAHHIGQSALVAVARMTIQSRGEDPRDASRAMQDFVAAIARLSDVERAHVTAVPPGFDVAGTLRGRFASSRGGDSMLAFETTVQFKSQHVQD